MASRCIISRRIVDGNMLSAWLENLPPSLIAPGPAPDGYAAVVGRREGGVSGYYWQALYGDAKLLFEAELPGNNYPAPVATRNEIYFVRPLDGMPALQCYSRRTGELRTISALPLRLTRGGAGLGLAVAGWGEAGAGDEWGRRGFVVGGDRRRVRVIETQYWLATRRISLSGISTVRDFAQISSKRMIIPSLTR